MDFFSFDSPFMSFLTKASEYMLVGLLCLLFSLPVITAGAAITAGYYVGMKLLRDEDAGFFKSFIKGFKENFKQSTVIWIIELLVGCFLSYDWYLIYKNGFENYNRIFVILLAVVTVFLAMAFLAVFALVARFKMSTKEAIKGAIAYTYINVPRMLFVLVLTVFPTIASLKYPNWLMAIWPVGTAAALY
ncbi:MAG: YesL family protein, partial [Lachnospiraceae bacterium]|nr:YesL family protein [Lachnospiraceae bacterium]